MNDYRESHLKHDQARWYETGVYAEGSYDSWLSELERPHVLALLRERFGDRPVRLLDFACGTGRILSFLEPHVASATGVDISEEMLAVARQKVQRATLIAGDVTTDPSLLEGPYDVITAFRFFLNAQEELRDRVLARLAAALDPKGILIFNIHANPLSVHLPVYIVRRYALGQRVNAMSRAQVEALVRRHGLEIVDVRGVGLLSRSIATGLGVRARGGAERLLRRFPALQRAAVDLIFVAQPVAGAARQP